MLKSVGESKYPCRTPTVVRNQSPMLLLKRTALVALLYRFLIGLHYPSQQISIVYYTFQQISIVYYTFQQISIVYYTFPQISTIYPNRPPLHIPKTLHCTSQFPPYIPTNLHSPTRIRINKLQFNFHSPSRIRINIYNSTFILHHAFE